MANFFDQFDAPAPATGGNFFDQFDEVPPPAAPAAPTPSFSATVPGTDSAVRPPQADDLPVPGSIRMDGTTVGVDAPKVTSERSLVDSIIHGPELPILGPILAYTAEGTRARAREHGWPASGRDQRRAHARQPCAWRQRGRPHQPLSGWRLADAWRFTGRRRVDPRSAGTYRCVAAGREAPWAGDRRSQCSNDGRARCHGAHDSRRGASAARRREVLRRGQGRRRSREVHC